jgi:hypothetical protein
MNSTKQTARIAGVLYLVNGVTGFFSIIYVPSRLMVSGNAAATAHNILASERLFRLGIASEVICAVEYIYLLWVLYRLLSGVSKTHASLMVIWGLAFVPIMCMNAVSAIAALTLFRGSNFLSVFDQPQRESLAMLFLDVRRYGYDVGWIFGLWLFHFGVCVWKSGFLPRFLGALLIAACFGYRRCREPIGEYPANAGRTCGYLVALDSGSKGSTIGSRGITMAETQSPVALLEPNRLHHLSVQQVAVAQRAPALANRAWDLRKA